MTGGISQGGPPQQPESGKFREFQDRYGGDEIQSNGQAPARARQAWDTGSRMSK